MKCFILLLFTLVSVNAKRILFASTYPLKSHQIYYHKQIDALVKRGYELTVVYPSYPKLDEEQLLNISKVILEADENERQRFRPRTNDFIKEISGLYEQLLHIFKDGFQKSEMKKLLEKEPDYFDLIILEPTIRMNILLTYFFKAPSIVISSLGAAQWIDQRVGASYSPIFYPCFHYRNIFNLSIIEKYRKIYEFQQVKALIDRYQNGIGEVILKETKNEVSYEDLFNKVDVFAVNIHDIWDFNRPKPPGLTNIGGLSVTNDSLPKGLPKDLQTFLDASKQGVVYISFGTNINSAMLPKDKVKIFVDVLSKLPYDILWKWDQNFNNTKNIKIVDWVPQSVVLFHPNIKLFISHGGMHSVNEAISAEVPMIVIPTKFDQWYNGEQSAHHGFARKLEIETLNEKELTESIVDVIENRRYRENIKRLKTLVTDMPQTPMEKFLWLVQYVLRQKTTKHVRSPAANIPLDQYLELELLGLVIVAFLIVFWIAILILRCVLDKLKKKYKN